MSFSKFIEKLNDLFLKYNIKPDLLYQKDDNVFLSTKLIKNKYLYDGLISLLNISGYYFSSYCLNGEKINNSGLDIKTFMENDYIDITFNKNFDFEDTGIKLNLYHITTKDKLNKIMDNGLVPKSKKIIDNHPDRIYLFEKIEDCLYFFEQKSNYLKNIKEPLILKINVKSLPKLKLYKDPKFLDVDAFYTHDNIPPHSLKIIEDD
jgi:hypothetical protein